MHTARESRAGKTEEIKGGFRYASVIKKGFPEESHSISEVLNKESRVSGSEVGAVGIQPKP